VLVTAENALNCLNFKELIAVPPYLFEYL
jgi:hypothetical protein